VLCRRDTTGLIRAARESAAGSRVRVAAARREAGAASLNYRNLKAAGLWHGAC